ncbi:MAG TPA: hypothetical protein VNJ11_02430 [Bryobacteraceae bacterium]|nr:hypothetical protein [Bryobacteraceae bacterium]
MALALRLAAIVVWDLHERPDPQGEWENIARNVAATGDFANPYGSPTGPTAHSAPAYPFLLSLAFRAAGTGSEGRRACIILNALLASLACALLPVLAAVAGLPISVGAAAGLASALVPLRLLSELMISAGGAQLKALTWITMHLLTLGWFSAGPASPTRWLAYGAAWGAAFHVDPALLPVCLFWTGVLARRIPGRHALRVFRRVAVMLVGVSLALLPWTLRNRRQLGAWIFVRSNAGLELAVSNHDSASPILAHEIISDDTDALGQWLGRHPSGSEKHRARIRAVGEVEYNRQRLGEALDWIRRNPARFAILSLQRFRYFWFYPGMTRRWRNMILFPMVFVGVWGLVRMVAQNRFLGLLFLGDWVAYPLTYYVIQVSGRYRYPIEWTILLLSCYAVWDWRSRRRTQAPGPQQAPRSGVDAGTRAA